MGASGTPGDTQPHRRLPTGRREPGDTPGRTPDRGLPKRRRVAENTVFRGALFQGPRFVGRLLVLRLWRSEDSGLRLGVIASKRTFRRAVDRNRAKRLVREAFRLNRHRLSGRADLVIVARKRIESARLPDVEQELLVLARKARLLEERP